MKRRHIPIERARQRGAALFVALILLVILTLIGVTAARLQTVEERMAQNDDNYQLAMQSAQAGLRQARQAVGSSAPWAMTFSANANGTYDLTDYVANTGSSIIDQPNWTASAIPYNGPALSNVPVPASGMVIEDLPAVATPGDQIPPGSSYGSTPPIHQARITVSAQGADATSTVTLQTVRPY